MTIWYLSNRCYPCHRGPLTNSSLPISLAALQEQVVLAVRQQYVALGDQALLLADGDEVAVVPPLSGG